MLAFERFVDAAVEMVVEVLAEDEEAEVVAVDDDEAEDKLDVDENAEIDAEEAGAGCEYAKSNSSSLGGSGKMMSVL